MNEDFNLKRRQPYLGEHYFTWRLRLLDDSIAYWRENTAPTGSDEAERKALTQRYLCSDVYRRFLLVYTSGGDIMTMRGALETVVEACERYTTAQRLSGQDPTAPPLVFEERSQYEEVMQLIGFCYLLHRRDLLPRIVGMLDPSYRGRDTLYEDLLAYELEDRINVDNWYHDVPYRPLVFSLYRETKQESVDDLASYLGAWYSGMADAPWYDSHLAAKKNGKGAYVGYWAVEAAVVAFLLQLDDSAFRDHPLYPRDLVDFARSFEESSARLSQT